MSRTKRTDDEYRLKLKLGNQEIYELKETLKILEKDLQISKNANQVERLLRLEGENEQLRQSCAEF